MKLRSLVLVLVTTSALGVTMAACNSNTPASDATGGSGGGAGAGAAGTSTSGGASGGASGAGAGASTGGSAGAGASSGGNASGGNASGGASGGGSTCKATTLYPSSMSSGTTLYCPFSKDTTMGSSKDISCDPSMAHCCVTTTAEMKPSYCAPAATSCAAGETDFQCADSVDCAGGKVCCGVGTIKNDFSATPEMCADYVSKFGGSKCETSCQSGEFQLCSQDSSCGAGNHCFALDAKGNHVGSCKPGMGSGGAGGSSGAGGAAAGTGGASTAGAAGTSAGGAAAGTGGASMAGAAGTSAGAAGTSGASGSAGASGSTGAAGASAGAAGAPGAGGAAAGSSGGLARSYGLWFERR